MCLIHDQRESHNSESGSRTTSSPTDRWISRTQENVFSDEIVGIVDANPKRSRMSGDRGFSESLSLLPLSQELRFLNNSPSYQSGWSKVFPVKGDPFWEKDGRRIKITGAELERLKSTNAGEEEKES